MTKACPQCAFANPAGFRFCGQCGAALEPAAPPGGAASRPLPPRALERKDEAERRQLTVMFCDLVGSTALSDRLDPEELRDVVRQYQQTAGAVIDRFDGYVAQYLGDGLLVYFGYPQAHEDAPRRAVHAGLGIVEAIGLLSAYLQRERSLQLGVRIGIHTGEVVAGEIGTGTTQEKLALGQTPNVAARVQAAATENTVVVSDSTFRLVQAFFTSDPLGAHALKGIARPLELHRILGETAFTRRFEGALSAGLGPLVGREHEYQMLVDCLSRVKEGAGQVVLLEAPPGVGKSRLLQALKDAPVAEDSSWWSCGGSSYGGDTPLLPIVELVETTAGIQREDSVDVKRDKARAWVSTFEPSLSHAYPLIARLLGMPPEEGYVAPQVTPQREKALVLDALQSILEASARERSVVLVVEDLQWVDPSTLEFLSLAIARAPESRVLLVLTFRPTFRPPWGEPAYLHHLKLDRLSDEQAASLARHVAGDRALPSSVLAQIVEKTDGVPLFVEELTKMVVESGQLQVEDGRYVLSGPLSSLQIPTTLQDSLMARLDRLQHLKALAQFASVLGREFTYEMLHEVRGDTSPVEDQLRQLVDAGLLLQQGVPPKATFTFKHALIQDAAYNSLLKSTRRHHHEQVARALERSFPATVDTRPELVAHHFTEAGLDDVAVSYWKRAGELSFSRSANLEAINHLQKALTLLARLPESIERDRRELELQTLLGPALNTTRGYASPDVERAFGRAHQLCERLGETPELFWTVRGQWTFYVVRGDLGRALDLGEQLLRVAQRQPDATLLFEAHYTLAIVAFWTGALGESLEHFEEALRVDSISDHRPGVRYTGQHTGVLVPAALAWLRWVQGYPDESLRYSEAAIARAGEVSHPLSVTMALYFSIWVHQLRGETDAVARRAREVIAHSREQGLFYDLLANLFVGWALARGDCQAATDRRATEEGIRLIRQCLDMNRASGARLAHTYYLSLLIDIDVRAGRFDDARQALDDAVATANDTGEVFWLAELYRLEGEMEMQRGGEGDDHLRRAAASFTKALEVARRQGARSLELRAAISLARLGGSPDERMAARRQLSAAYGAFTEGAETADLSTARMLLADWV